MNDDTYNGKIYTITSPDVAGTYVGSTHQEIDERIKQHEREYLLCKDGRRGKTMSHDLIETGNYVVRVIEDYPCANRQELELREGIWQEYYRRRHMLINKFITGQKFRDDYNMPIQCPCGSIVKNRGKIWLRHYKTNRHLTYLNDELTRINDELANINV